MSDSPFNWIVPLRRVVIKREVRYRQLLWEWLRLLSPVPISQDGAPAVGTEGGPASGVGSRDQLPSKYRAEVVDPAEHFDDVDINEWVIRYWYNDTEDGEFTAQRYYRGVSRLRHWWQDTFLGQLTSSNAGTTTKGIPEYNFHARLWKGPKRILRELRAADEPERLEALRPYTWEGKRVGTRPDAGHRPRTIELLPGDVLELPLHAFLHACLQLRFAKVEFDPLGSFFLGTSVHVPGQDRSVMPQLHDNMLAMRYQLLHSLAMANCYHDKPVFSADYQPSAPKLRPEGAGVYARGMTYGGNLSAKIKDERWILSSASSHKIDEAMPKRVPTYDSLVRLAKSQPVTWQWVCSPFAAFWLHYLAVGHRSAMGIDISSLRGSSMGTAVMTSHGKGWIEVTKDEEAKYRDPDNTHEHDFDEDDDDDDDDKKKKRKKNPKKKQIKVYKNLIAREKTHKLQEQHGGDLLLLHGTTIDKVVSPREQTPVADLVDFLFPKDYPRPPARDFSNPEVVHEIPDPPKEGEDVALDTLCPGAGLIMFSSKSGHEFAVSRLNYADRLRERAIEAMIAGQMPEEVQVPIGGELGAYCPLSGVDRVLQAKEADAEAAEKQREADERKKKKQEQKKKKQKKKKQKPDKKKKNKNKNKVGEDSPQTPDEDDEAEREAIAAAIASRDRGQYFIDESTGTLPPKDRNKYSLLRLSGISIHVFKRIYDNAVFLQRVRKGKKSDDEEEGGKKKKNKKQGKTVLKVREGGARSLRNREVSTIIYLRHGTLRDPNPRTLTNIYGTRQDWLPLTLKPPNRGFPDEEAFLADWQTLYAERAVPFPAMIEIAGAFPTREQVEAQLANHRKHIDDIYENKDYWKAKGDPIVHRINKLDKEIESLQRKYDEHKKKADGDKLTDAKDERDEQVAKLNKFKDEYHISTMTELREELLEHMPPKAAPKPEPKVEP